jgi:hypothetical protein
LRREPNDASLIPSVADVHLSRRVGHRRSGMRGGFGEMPFIGTWFVFWPVGVRLFVAGLRQVLQPSGIPIQP